MARAAAPEGASMRRRGLRVWLRAWQLRHAQTFFYTLGQVLRHPLNTLLTAAVIGIALALPAGLQVMLDNAHELTKGWDGSAQISLFLQPKVSEQQAQALARELEALPEISTVRYISRAQALEEFKALSGFGDVLHMLDENPLPAVLLLTPLAQQSPAALEAMIQRLQARAEVNIAQLDMQWIKRVYAMLGVVHRILWVLAGLLGLSVLLVVGNTIRLAIQNRRDEIVVIKLIGGTDAFIRRPFLYTGFWYGLFGSLIALIMVLLALWLQVEPVARLAALYDSHFQLRGPGFLTVLGLIVGGCLLGLAGSWLAVGRHLREIEPS